MGLVLVGGGAAWLAAKAKFTFLHPSGARLEVRDRRVLVSRTPLQAAAGENMLGTPQVQVSEKRFHFGTMDALTSATHDFVVRNVGTFPLKLTPAGTSCKCTISNIDQTEVPPGGEARVTLEWRTPRSDDTFSHHAIIKTNDPIHRQLRFEIVGTVRMQLAVEPAYLHFDNLLPDESRTFKALLLSQTWDHFEIASGNPSLENATWTATPLDAKFLEFYKATSGYEVSITTPPDLPRGSFKHWLRLDIVADDATEPEPFDIHFSGEVMGRLAVIGSAIEASGVVSLGTLRQGEEVSVALLLKVRDEEKELPVASIETSPDFLEAEVTARSTELNTLGLYEMKITLPATTAPCRHMAGEAGRVRVVFDHPRITDLDLSVEFIVLPR